MGSGETEQLFWVTGPISDGTEIWSQGRLVPKQFLGLREGDIVKGENRSLWQCQLTDAPKAKP